MAQQLILLLIKVLVGTSLGLLGVYNQGREKIKKQNQLNKMRIFDDLTADTKIDILETAIAYAKKDIADNNLNVDLVSHACGFGEMFLLQPVDFGLITPEVITAFVGSMPPHRPKVW